MATHKGLIQEFWHINSELVKVTSSALLEIYTPGHSFIGAYGFCFQTLHLWYIMFWMFHYILILIGLLHLSQTLCFSYPVHVIFAATLNPRPSPHNMHNRDTIEYLKLYNPLVSWIWQEVWVCCPCTKSSGEISTPPPNLLHMEPIYLSDSSSGCFLACMLLLLEPSSSS